MHHIAATHKENTDALRAAAAALIACADAVEREQWRRASVEFDRCDMLLRPVRGVLRIRVREADKRRQDARDV